MAHRSRPVVAVAQAGAGWDDAAVVVEALRALPVEVDAFDVPSPSRVAKGMRSSAQELPLSHIDVLVIVTGPSAPGVVGAWGDLVAAALRIGRPDVLRYRHVGVRPQRDDRRVEYSDRHELADRVQEDVRRLLAEPLVRDELSTTGSPVPLPLEKELVGFYPPSLNERRNDAKRKAIRSEDHGIRLLAHGGASYFMPSVQRFAPDVTVALRRGVAFRAVITDPWSPAGRRAAHEERVLSGCHDTDVADVESSDYFQYTYCAVRRGYEAFRAAHGPLVELRLTSLDLPGTALLTTTTGFFEPYTQGETMNRTQRRLQTFEIEFSSGGEHYATADELFEAVWNTALPIEDRGSDQRAMADDLARAHPGR